MSARLERWLNRLLVALCVIWILVHLAVLLAYDYGRDQGIYAYVARVILNGGMPYRDAWDYKPPGIFLVFALSRLLFGPGVWGIRVLEAIGLCGMVVAMVQLARVMFDNWRVGLLAGALAVGVHVQMDFWHTAQPASFGGMLIIAALLVASRPGAARLATAGLIFGLVALLKPTMGGAAVVIAAWRGWEAWKQRRRLASALLPAVLIFSGMALPVLACLGWLAAGGALGAAREVFTGFAPAYTKLGWAGKSVLAVGYRAFADYLVLYSSALLVGQLLLVGFGARRGERTAAIVIALVCAAELVGVAVQAKFFAYHFGAVWPAAALLAALGWWKLIARGRERGPVAAFATLGFLGLMLFARTAGPIDLQHSYTERLRLRLESLVGAGGKATDDLDAVGVGHPFMQASIVHWAARRIVSVVPANRSLYVWGFEPSLYVYTGMRAPTRYFYNQAPRLALTAGVARPELMRDLKRDRPGAIVLIKHDEAPDVLGDDLDSFTALRTFPQLAAFIKSRYVPLAEYDYMTILIDRKLKH